MKIETANNTKPVILRSIPIGNCFRYDWEIFMYCGREDNDIIMTVNLRTGRIHQMYENTLVEPVSAKVVIE